MSDNSNPGTDRSIPGKPIYKSRSVAGTIAVIVLVGLYTLLAPVLERSLGIDLPNVVAGVDGEVRVADDANTKRQNKIDSRPQKESDSSRSTSKLDPTPKKKTVNRSADRDRFDAKRDATDSGKSTTKSSTKSGQSSVKSKNTNVSKRPPPKASSDSDLLHGVLKEISRDRYISLEGLVYGPGSAEGHRLKHVDRHTKDSPNRPGKHGVFDGNLSGALKTIDQAYARAQKNQRTTKKVDDGRTIYTVDMGKRVGYIGGRDGKRKRNPMARRVRLVLEGNKVITAYPM